MANQLRASGFKVFVEKTLDDVEEYFVMIGPKLSKERILMVKKTLQKEFALETQIFRYVYED
jgi:cell division septation protein DedD